MNQAERLRFRKGDLLAIVLVLALAVLVMVCFLSGKKASSGEAVIHLDGEKIQTVDLTENQTFVVEGRYRNEITVSDGEISVTDSNCPGQDCVHSGSISTQGRILVCLPNGLEIRITSAEEDVDFVVR